MRVTVLGAGSFGTSLAKVCADAGHDVYLWSHSADTPASIMEFQENRIYLPGIRLPDAIVAGTDLKEAFRNSGLILSVIPTQVTRSVWTNMETPDVPVIVASKGIETGTHLTVAGIFHQVLPAERHKNLLFLSGPSFARELALEHPTAVTLAGSDRETITQVQSWIKAPYLRIYGTDDITGVEIGGALKNVMAIATGMAEGLGFGYNARAALITRGLAEIARLGVRMGAQPLTFMGLAGLGDLVLTCTGDLSRNRTVGLRLGKGETLQQITADSRMVAEGIATTLSAHELATSLGVEMPITAGVYSVLYNGLHPKGMVSELMGRSLRFENDSYQ